MASLVKTGEEWPGGKFVFHIRFLVGPNSWAAQTVPASPELSDREIAPNSEDLHQLKNPDQPR